MEVKDQGHWSKTLGQKYLFLQCNTLIGSNSGSVKHRAVKFACSMGFWLWLIKWCNCHLCHVTGSDHL